MKMAAIFILKKDPLKKANISIFLKACYFVLGSSIAMNVGMF